ncbi:MAG: class I adenylate-forming enzyme family protein [Myxococcota bacterium]
MDARTVSADSELRTILDVLTARAAHEPERVALRVIGGPSLTFGEWERRANAAAHALLDAGVNKGDVVALFFDDRDWVDYAVAYIGAYKAGAATVHMNPWYPEAELERRIEQCGIETLVHSADLRPPKAGRVLSADALHHEDVTAPDVPLGPKDLADIAYTAGTTEGRSKGVMVEHDDYLLGIDLEEVVGNDSALSFLGPFPAGTPSSQNILLMGMAMPRQLLLLDEPSPQATWDAIESEAITNVMITPGMAVDLVNLPCARQGVLESVTSLSVGAAAIAPTMIARLIALFPNASVTQYYLSLESIPAMVASSYDPKRPGAVGKPLPGTGIEIRNQAGEALGTGEIGDIWMQPAGRVRAYKGDPEWNARTFHGAWMSMGDKGFMDEDGYCHFYDRAADVISGPEGFTSTLAVEDALFQHPGVRDACVVGVPGADGATRVAAALVLAPGAAVDDVLSVCREHVAPHQVPSEVRVEGYLPRGIIGKTLKREVRKWFHPNSGDAALLAHREDRVRYW